MLESFITFLIANLEHYAQNVPLELFIFLGAITEELIAPLPSPLVMTLAGSVAASQGKPFAYLFLLSLIGSAGKTCGAYLFYFLADKAEDILIPRFGKYIGVTHEDVESFGKRFNGNTWKDDIVMLLLRCIPMMPSTPISVAAGVLKIRLRTFIVATLGGFYIRDLFFILLGYWGMESSRSILEGVEGMETILKVLIVGGGLAFVGWLYYRRRIGKPAEWLSKKAE